MTETFFISDTHFGHKNIIKFADANGQVIRPFESVEAMNEHMVEKWNSVVGKQDKVIHCGDFAFGRPALEFGFRLNGIKHLVLGNHDNFSISAYQAIFSKIYGVKYIGEDVAICTHIPIALECMRGFKLNIHGHLHHNVIPDVHYFNVAVEQINYTPISLDEILQKKGLA